MLNIPRNSEVDCLGVILHVKNAGAKKLYLLCGCRCISWETSKVIPTTTPMLVHDDEEGARAGHEDERCHGALCLGMLHYLAPSFHHTSISTDIERQ